MPKLKELQDNFSAYLLSENDAIAKCVVDQGALDRYSRLGIYKNAYQVRLIGCIETDHPILSIYLGDDLFDKMASGYLAKHPSQYPSLRHYCDHLPEYLSLHEPFKSVPILSEIAHFERAMMSAFDAADTEQRATREDLQNIDPNNWPAIKLDLHPSTIIFSTAWNSVESWQALKNEETPPFAAESDAYWIIWRGLDRLTQFRRIPFEAYTMLNCFNDDYSFSDICEFLLEHLPGEQIGPATVQHLSNWLDVGIVHRIKD